MRSAKQAAEAWARGASEAQREYMSGCHYRSPREEYEHIREMYVIGSYDLEDFAAHVVRLLERVL